MGLRLITDERLFELESEAESNKAACQNMVKAHEKLLTQYRELRDAKDAEIARLHAQIEDLKREVFRKDLMLKQFKKGSEYFETRGKT